MHSLAFPRRAAIIAALFLLCLPLISAQAAPGDIDPTFGVGGKVTTPIYSSFDYVRAIAVQPDGKIVVAGSAHNGSNYDFALARYTASGLLDTTFDGDGKVTTQFSGASQEAVEAVVIQSDGKIIVAGYMSNGADADFALVRYNSNGSRDTSFDGDGLLTTQFFGGDDQARAIALQPDGKIVVAGFVGSGFNFISGLVRYNADGSLDTTFDTDGKVTTQFSGNSDLMRAIAIQPDGKIVVAGSTIIGYNYNFALARYNPDGSLDSSFDGDGRVTTSFIGNTDEAYTLALQPDGKIVAAGYTYNSLDEIYLFALARYNTDGSLDSAFDADGKVTTAFPGTDARAHGIVIQPNGRIVAAGYSRNTTEDFALARYNMDGSLDSSLDGDGQLTTPFSGSTDIANAVALQPNGKIIAGGSARNGTNDDFALARYLGDTTAIPGNLDITFDGDGKTTTPFSSNNLGNDDTSNGVILQPDGKSVAVGHAFTGSVDFALARYNTNGSLDTTFDGDGLLTTDFGANDYGQAVALQPDGKIVVVGYTATGVPNGMNQDFAIARYQADGSLDNSFDGDGRLVTNFVSGNDYAYAVVIQTDGKILVAGAGTNASGGSDFALARYHTDGSFDNTLDGDGKVLTDFGGSESARAIVLQTDGKIVAAGSCFVTGSIDFAVVRYNADGSLDSAFDTDGRVSTNLLTHDEAYAVLIQPDGKILVAGNANTFQNNFALARYNADGSLDNSFDGDGRVTTDFGKGSGVRSIILQPDGHILAGGFLNFSTPGNVFALARYDRNGNLDQRFGEGGRGTTSFGNNGGLIYGMAMRDGRITVAGSSHNGVNLDFALARYYVTTEVRSDFDGDHLTDISVWQSDSGKWHIIESATNLAHLQFWGQSALGDIAVPGDYDGDGRTDISIYRPSEGNWYILQSSGAGVVQNWGQAGDRPVAADYDGDGLTDLAVYRPSEGNWYVRKSAGGSLVQGWGDATDKLVPADYDGDGRADIAVFRPTEGNWYILKSSGGLRQQQWGIGEDKPVPGDYDGDGQTDIAVWRPSQGNWYIILSTGGGIVRNWGDSADQPVPADYDVDGKTDIAVWRPAQGTWYIIRSSTNSGIQRYLGLSADTPLPAAYLPQ
ncbi:MAG TPA: FG-GAP-like repeat-containing protein [Pyrinomonadaceae bacterium]|jgi:uncharacterized delta-60 repeat protein